MMADVMRTSSTNPVTKADFVIVGSSNTVGGSASIVLTAVLAENVVLGLLHGELYRTSPA